MSNTVKKSERCDDAPHLRRIHIDDLEVGMYVEKYGQGTFKDPFAYPRQEIVAVEQIEFMRKSGAVDVFIDPGRGVGGTIAPDSGLPLEFLALEHKIPFVDELPVAAAIHAKTLRHARDLMDAARRHGRLDHAASREIVSDIAASVDRNESAAACLAKLGARNGYHVAHLVNVGILAVLFARHLGMSEAETHEFGLAGLYHDIGKARLPEAILNKPGPLSPWERKLARSHAVEGYRLLRETDGISEAVAGAALEHHERPGGKGYPRGLGDGETHLYGRLLAVIDVFDAITSDRPYARAKPAAEAFRLMYSMRGKEFETRILELFIKSMGIFPVGSFVRLNNGHYAVVCEANSDQPLRPSVKLVFDPRLRPCRAEFVDLADASGPDGRNRLEIHENLDPRLFGVDVLRLLT
ncbi:metal dependent phosphohydrolase [Alkalidesulfovibrio alkalitolerans DSM 16529]|uniref:Metal dependent phosphohydrolase n=1 Tax=Alkalidesulfovibrio alkalitolerans DSM 16529 TaxID=1121439 RepID=S7UTW6_9BACT|nr:HD-GYP domain-containing protein [Alkalidesulfovibrio alkalitolerans]EPR35753.1 metal dependent phosphohydrolase [Alkalidesulfovibrio alkalitolerans DSM 16529]